MLSEQVFVDHFYTYKPYVEKRAKQLFRNRDEQQDFVQEVWKHIWERSGNYQGNHNIAPLVWVENNIRWAYAETVESFDKHVKTVSNLDVDFSSGAVSGAVRQDHRRLAIDLGIKREKRYLTYDQLDVLHMVGQDFNMSEIAKEWGVTKEAVRYHVKTAARTIGGRVRNFLRAMD